MVLSFNIHFKRNEEYNWSLHEANKPKVEPQYVTLGQNKKKINPMYIS